MASVCSQIHGHCRCWRLTALSATRTPRTLSPFYCERNSAAPPATRASTDPNLSDLRAQYISVGNLSENDRAFLFVMDYERRQRIKIWGRARVVEDDPALIQSLMPLGYAAKPERTIVFEIAAWDVNCPQHIPQKLDSADVAATIDALKRRISALESENAELKAARCCRSPERSAAGR
jgi:hypothetical protein